MSNTPIISITPSTFAKFSTAPLDMLRDAGLHIRCNQLGRTLTEEESLQQLRGATGVIAGTEPLTRRVLTALPDLHIISRCGTGLDSVDLEAAQACGIRVRTTPDAPTLAVAELTLGMMLDLLRHVSRMDREVRAGTWKKRMGSLLCGKRTGIIGMGRIGSTVARLCAAFGAHVAYADPSDARGTGFPRMALDDLLRWSEILTLHCPLPTRHGASGVFPAPLLGRRELELLPHGALVLNLARGGLIDEDALYDLLCTEALGGAGLDVYRQEPYAGRLRMLPNVILTPHCASYAREARIRMEIEAVRNLLNALAEYSHD